MLVRLEEILTSLLLEQGGDKWSFKSSKGRNVGKPVRGYKTSSIGDALSPQIALLAAWWN